MNRQTAALMFGPSLTVCKQLEMLTVAFLLWKKVSLFHQLTKYFPEHVWFVKVIQRLGDNFRLIATSYGMGKCSL